MKYFSQPEMCRRFKLIFPMPRVMLTIINQGRFRSFCTQQPLLRLKLTGLLQTLSLSMMHCSQCINSNSGDAGGLHSALTPFRIHSLITHAFYGHHFFLLHIEKLITHFLPHKAQFSLKIITQLQNNPLTPPLHLNSSWTSKSSQSSKPYP